MNPHQIMKVWIQVDTAGFSRAVIDTFDWYLALPPPTTQDDPPPDLQA